MPVTIVVLVPVVADTFVLLLLHAPPKVVELNDVVKPTHTASTPVIGAGFGFTVTIVVLKHASPNV